jgi:DNA-binding IclR family transcriptional regulator
MHLVPSGIVFMAHWPPAELDRYLGRDLEATTPRSVTDGAAIRAKLATALEAGYVAGFEEFADGLNSVAAPLLNSDGVPEAAVHVHGPAYRFPADGDPAAVGEMLVATCARIAGQLELVT